MEASYWNHMELAPATTSGVYQYEDPESFMLGYELLNGIGPMHYGPTLYEPLPIFPHPAGYVTNAYQSYTHGAPMHAANIMPCEPQINFLQQLLFHRNFMRFEDNIPMAYYSQERGGLFANNLIGHDVQEGIVHHPQWIDGRLLHPGFLGNKYTAHELDVYNGRFFGNNESIVPTHSCRFHCSPTNANFMSSGHNMVGGYLSPGYNMDDSMWSDISDGITYAISPGASSSQFNDFPMPSNRILDESYVDEDSYRSFYGSVSSSKPFSWDQAGVRNKNEHGYRSTVRTSPHKSSTISPTVRASGRINREEQSGQRGQAQRSKPTWSSKDPAQPVKRNGIQNTSVPEDHGPPTKRNGNQKTSASRQVWRERTKTQASSGRSKPSSKRTEKSLKHTNPRYYITWDGFDEPCEPVGQNCHLCEKDLSYMSVPTDDEHAYYDAFEPSNLPEVAVLACGHAFHSECLQLITPEEQSRNPPCCLCISCMI